MHYRYNVELSQADHRLPIMSPLVANISEEEVPHISFKLTDVPLAVVFQELPL